MKHRKGSIVKIDDIWGSAKLPDGEVIHPSDYMSPEQRLMSERLLKQAAFLAGLDEFRAWFAADLERVDVLELWTMTDTLYPVLTVQPYINSTDRLAELRRKLGSCEKLSTDGQIGFGRTFDNFATIRLLISKHETCELVETGEFEDREVREVIEPAVVVTKMERVPVKEWRCPPSLLEVLADQD
jgi:hypothetical protein